MNQCGLWIAMGTLLAASAAAAENTARDQPAAATQPDLARLQGTWRALKLQIGERSVEVPGRSKKNPGVSLELHGDHYEFRGLGTDFKGHVRADASTKAQRLEFVRDDGTTTISSYRLEGDSLKLTGVSANPNGKDAEKDAEVWTFRREKP